MKRYIAISGILVLLSIMTCLPAVAAEARTVTIGNSYPEITSIPTIVTNHDKSVTISLTATDTNSDEIRMTVCSSNVPEKQSILSAEDSIDNDTEIYLCDGPVLCTSQWVTSDEVVSCTFHHTTYNKHYSVLVCDNNPDNPRCAPPYNGTVPYTIPENQLVSSMQPSDVLGVSTQQSVSATVLSEILPITIVLTSIVFALGSVFYFIKRTDASRSHIQPPHVYVSMIVFIGIPCAIIIGLPHTIGYRKTTEKNVLGEHIPQSNTMAEYQVNNENDEQATNGSYPIYFIPSYQAEIIYDAYDGEEFTMIASIPGWTSLQLPDGLIGWIPSSSLR